ncbi:MAG TPA: 23S rRNA (pseudouridine(1915)-N(3))-methyltransferase RlmH [Puia sp.]|nr:23S rRNA (pseudouridine(1915)-N(3))-methyltransferase RlmH [Puia sp.]
MKIQLWTVGKAHEAELKNAIEDFTNRLTKYFHTEWTIISPFKNFVSASAIVIKGKEAETILSLLKKDDYLIALDEKGKQFSSTQLAQFIQLRTNESKKNLVFVIGGAFGLGAAVLDRADFKWSLSQLTFPHQLVRLMLAEQLYRACTIIRNEKYHHS